ncbi:transcription repressor NadR [Peptostreptococcus canis]|uniref:Transcription repressor NadR n=1 Tax=Peptostreptococcus canis TaxID=1159213 RepID=A0ABR6TIB1_9FIRM|nr:transcription repressor NadR [Peptostreptococcus canis]MBC2575158.1 transcription repressor NadR [Peptostreptococcus canis]MBP1997668.1 transcriptional regulator of NAD metabolism [Peptostreptococcus canis]
MNKTDERREKILKVLIENDDPINGTELSKIFGVSRQVIVQDIAILKEKNNDIISTNRGYKIFKKASCVRVIKVSHSDEDIENELNIIVDLGAVVKDVFISHKAYGKINIDLNIKSRRDGQNLNDRINAGISKPLKNLTNGYHYHTIMAESEEILDEVVKKLDEAGYLVK